MSEPNAGRPFFTRTDLRVVLLCFFGYSGAYLGRLDMVASILPMQEALGWTKAQLGGIAFCFFFAYAGGQLASGILAHFFNPRWSFGLAVAGTALLNLLAPFVPSLVPAGSALPAMRAVWFLNGAAQSLLWCSVVKALAQRVSERAMPRAIVAISSTISVGTVAAFGSAALGAELGLWRTPFLFAAAWLGLAAVLWFAFFRFPEDAAIAGAPHAAAKAYPRATRWTAGGRPARPYPMRSVVLFVAAASLACAACGYMRDGLSTWSANALKDVFGLKDSLSILLALALPLVGLFGAWLNKRYREREPLVFRMTSVCFVAATALVGVALFAIEHPHLALAIASFAGVYLAMIMVTNAITSIFCLAYRTLFDAALVAGIVDTACYVASSFAAWSLGRAADAGGAGGGWSRVFGLLALSGLAGLAFSVLAARLERRAAAAAAGLPVGPHELPDHGEQARAPAAASAPPSTR